MAAPRARFADPVAAALRAAPERIVLTGASGWLGMATLEMLEEALGAEALAGRVAAFGSTERLLTLRSGTRIAQLPLAALHALDTRPSFVLHHAFLTKDRAEAMPEAEYRAANAALAAQVIRALPAIGATGVFLPSSGAVHFAQDAEAGAAMRLYGTLKREDELRFGEWAADNGTTLVIARVFNLSGPYINKPHAYALAAFILDALAGRPIAIQATRPVLRAFAAIRELMSLAFALLLEPSGRITRFDVSGTETLEMAEIAAAVQAALGQPAAIVRPALSGAPASIYAASEQLYPALLQHAGIARVPLDAQIRETAAFLAETVAA